MKVETKDLLRKKQGNIPSYVVIVKRIYRIRLIPKDYMLSFLQILVTSGKKQLIPFKTDQYHSYTNY